METDYIMIISSVISLNLNNYNTKITIKIVRSGINKNNDYFQTVVSYLLKFHDYFHYCLRKFFDYRTSVLFWFSFNYQKSDFVETGKTWKSRNEVLHCLNLDWCRWWERSNVTFFVKHFVWATQYGQRHFYKIISSVWKACK